MSKLIDRVSVPSTKTELDLFQVPPTQVAVEQSRWKEVHLQNPCTNEGPYTFHISPDPQMIHLAKNYLFMQFRVVRGNNAALVVPVPVPVVGEADRVGPINLLAKTFFRQIKLYLNGTEVFDSGTNYAYRAFLETELNYGTDAKASQLKAALYYKDEPHDHLNDDNNIGWRKRRDVFQNGGWVQLMAPIHCDLFMQDRYLVNNVDLRLVLYRNTDPFCLTTFVNADRDYKIEVNAMRWYVKGVEVIRSVGLSLEKTMRQFTAKYPVRRVEIKNVHASAGRRETPENAIFNGQVPRRLIIGCVAAAAYHGTYGTSPFNFQNFNINEISVTAAGDTYPTKPLSLDFAHDLYARGFLQLFEGLGIGCEDKGNGIDMLSFKSGCCLFPFDLSPDEDDGSHWDLVRDGATSVDIKFADALPAGGVEVIVYAEFDNLISLDYNRNPYTDYKA